MTNLRVDGLVPDGSDRSGGRVGPWTAVERPAIPARMNRALTLFLAVLAVSAPGLAGAADVLLIWDVQNSNTTSLQNALQAAGHTVTLSSTNESSYTGSNPAPSGFQTVIHLNGTTYVSEMPVAGQNALLSFVQGGGGFIGHEWSAYQISNGQMTAMTDLTLAVRSSGTGETVTLTEVAAQSSHPVLASVPASFTTPSTDHNEGAVRSFSSYPATVLMTDQSGNAAVVVREYMAGRVVYLHHAGNYSSGTILSNATMQALYVDAVNWTVGSCDNDNDGYESISCGGLDCADGDASAFPGAFEVCDDVDQDCDGDVVETFSDSDFDNVPDCVDPDDDGDGDPDGSDCAPLDPSINSFGTETCNGIDDDCNGTADDVDDDLDGYSGCFNDCDDANWNVNPGASENCDTIDSNCDGSLVDGFADTDGDGDPDCVDADIDGDGLSNLDESNLYGTDPYDADSDDDGIDDGDEIADGTDPNDPDDPPAGDDDDATGDDDDDATGDDDDDNGGGRSSRRGGCAVTGHGSGAWWALLLVFGAIARTRRGAGRATSA